MAASRGSRKKRVWAYILFFLAFLFGSGVVEGDSDWKVSLFYALVAGGVATLLLRSVWKDEEKAVEMARGERQLAVVRLAEREDGQLTVTEVAAKLGWSVDEAAATLRSMEDGVRVTTTVTDEGVILYDFPELIHDPGRKKRLR
ncbi:hypothetical protein [Longimicrobium sp.]|uniref:hypothetical protein n=1 Tax=Longimicrobium sp. TaxID=2029185 RepID=UPI003B3AA553